MDKRKLQRHSDLMEQIDAIVDLCGWEKGDYAIDLTPDEMDYRRLFQRLVREATLLEHNLGI